MNVNPRHPAMLYGVWQRKIGPQLYCSMECRRPISARNLYPKFEVRLEPIFRAPNLKISGVVLLPRHWRPVQNTVKPVYFCRDISARGCGSPSDHRSHRSRTEGGRAAVSALCHPSPEEQTPPRPEATLSTPLQTRPRLLTALKVTALTRHGTNKSRH